MQVIRLASVIEATGLGRSSIYKLIAEGGFPQSISLGGRSVGWVSEEIETWIKSKIEERDLAVSKYASVKSQVSTVMISKGQAQRL